MTTTTNEVETAKTAKATIEARMSNAAARGDIDGYHTALADLRALGPVPTGYDAANDLVSYNA